MGTPGQGEYPPSFQPNNTHDLEASGKGRGNGQRRPTPRTLAGLSSCPRLQLQAPSGYKGLLAMWARGKALVGSPQPRPPQSPAPAGFILNLEKPRKKSVSCAGTRLPLCGGQMPTAVVMLSGLPPGRTATWGPDFKATPTSWEPRDT